MVLVVQPELARTLGHADQHDVHDADTANEQADAGHRRQQQRHDRAPRLLGPRNFGQVAD